MRNFANYHVDVRRHTSGVVKTICEQCLPTRHNKRDRSLQIRKSTRLNSSHSRASRMPSSA